MIYIIGASIFLLITLIIFFITTKKHEEYLKQQLKEKNEEIKNLQYKLSEETKKRIQLEEHLSSTQKYIEEQKKLIETAENKLKETFSYVSKEALNTNSELFIKLANENISKITKELIGVVEQKEEAIKGIIRPLSETLYKYETYIKDIEEKRQKSYGSLENQLTNIGTLMKNIERETNNLVNALRKPNVKGRWGEVTLKRVVETIGMSEYCDFSEQTTVKDNLRPDMIIKLPNEKIIIVDSKVPLEAYLNSLEAKDENERKKHIKKHASLIEEHIKNLSNKKYWEKHSNTLNFVIMFIPGEVFLSAALEGNKNLFEIGLKNNVIITTPTSLAALLNAISFSWRESKLEKNAQKIKELGQELFERFEKFIQHFASLGIDLERTVSTYNKATGSFNARLIPSVKKLIEYGAAEKKQISEPKQIEKKTTNPIMEK